MEQETAQGLNSDAVDAVSNQAKSVGIAAVPAFVLGQRYAVLGLQPLEAFDQTMARLTQAPDRQ
ncbi:MAG: hypothetical protein JSW55_19680 [Chloroflexota bacterium]|nr:MAG: hypothetical protein JSW55_19680 [Chloroflexota bacterium]